MRGAEQYWGKVPWQHPSFNSSSTAVRVLPQRGDGLATGGEQQNRVVGISMSAFVPTRPPEQSH